MTGIVTAGEGIWDMQSAIAQCIEADIRQLPLGDQLWLMERLVQHIRDRTASEPLERQNLLAEMAQDPEIQRELHRINAEFAAAERDGLDEAA